MSLIIYSDVNSPNQYGIKQISDIVLKRLAYNEIHKKCRFNIPREKIEEEFGVRLNTEKSQIELILMTELSSTQLDNYLEIYEDEKDNINEFAEFLAIITYNQINPEKFSVKKKLDLLISSISEYWENPANCHISLTNKFIIRRFNNIFNLNEMTNQNESIPKTGKINWEAEQINYLEDIIRDQKFYAMFVKNYSYPIKSTLSNNDAIQIYLQLPTEYLKYMFISNMLCSRVHCHLILNNQEFLKISKPMFDKYKLVFKYLIGYSWITLKNEELNIYVKIHDDDRIIFDIDTASLLPIFPFTYDDINQNPYTGILIDTKAMDIKNNCVSTNMMKKYEKYYGVCNSDEFSKRLNIFVNGENKKGVLENIDWNCCAITGSVMTACGMKYNPLIDIFRESNSPNNSTNPTDGLTDADLSSFFFHHYQDSDIDVVCNKQSVIDFIKVVNNFVNSYSEVSKVNVSKVHTSTIIVSDDFLIEQMESLKKALKKDNINLDWIKSNLSLEQIKKYFYDGYYIPWKQSLKETINNDNNITKSKLLDEYLKLTTIEEFKINKMDYDVDLEQMTEKSHEKYFYQEINGQNKLIGKLSESIRFKVKFPGTKTFEIFKSRDESFFSTISRFHMGFVRALWNGKTVKCLPSYITAMMTQLATDYKYFASIKDPIEIVNKYRSRGFGIVLNDYEKLHMAYYNTHKSTDVNSSQNHWVDMYKVNIKNKDSVKSIFGVKKSSDDIFKPSKYFMGLPQDCFKNISHETSSTFDECFSSLITTPKLSQISKYKAIGDSGKINPLEREVIMMGWNLINSPNINGNNASQYNIHDDEPNIEQID